MCVARVFIYLPYPLFLHLIPVILQQSLRDIF